MLWNLRRVFFKTDDGKGGGAGGGSGDGDETQRKANAAAVDQVHDHEDRIKVLEGGFFDRIAAALKPASTSTPPATGEVKTGAQAAPKPKTVIDELGECMDPFGLFDETPPPTKKPEAPASDEAAA